MLIAGMIAAALAGDGPPQPSTEDKTCTCEAGPRLCKPIIGAGDGGIKFCFDPYNWVDALLIAQPRPGGWDVSVPSWQVDRGGSQVLWVTTVVLDSVADPRVATWRLLGGGVAVGLDAKGVEVERWESKAGQCSLIVDNGHLLVIGASVTGGDCAATGSGRVTVRGNRSPYSVKVNR